MVRFLNYLAGAAALVSSLSVSAAPASAHFAGGNVSMPAMPAIMTAPAPPSARVANCLPGTICIPSYRPGPDVLTNRKRIYRPTDPARLYRPGITARKPYVYRDSTIPQYRNAPTRQRYHGIRLPERHLNWCSDRYRSYDADDNSFQPRKGARRLCISPYI